MSGQVGSSRAFDIRIRTHTSGAGLGPCCTAQNAGFSRSTQLATPAMNCVELGKEKAGVQCAYMYVYRSLGRSVPSSAHVQCPRNGCVSDGVAALDAD